MSRQATMIDSSLMIARSHSPNIALSTRCRLLASSR